MQDPALCKELSFLEGVGSRCPDNPWVLRPLADLYTRAGRIAEGLAVDLRLTGLAPEDPLVWYNLACSYALSSRSDDAIAALEQAFDRGYTDAGWIRQDDDLKSVADDPRLAELLQRMSRAKHA